MESHFSVKVIPTLLQEAQFLSHYFTPPKNLPKLLPDYEAVLTGKRIHPVKYQHAHGPGVPIELLGSLEVRKKCRSIGIFFSFLFCCFVFP